MSKLKEIAGQIKTYVSAFALTQIITVSGSLLIRWLLGPLQVGVWSLVQVILTYIDYPNLGATYAIPIEIPSKKAKGENQEADSMKNTIFGFSFLTSGIFALGVLIFAFWKKNAILPELFYGLLIASGLVILQQMNNILISLLRAYKNFDLAGKVMVWSSLVNFVLIVSFSSLFKLYGFMFAMFFSFSFNIAFILFHHPFPLKLSIDFKILFELIRYGFPLMILGLMTTFLLTMDQVIIARKLGVTSLGFYSIAVMTTGFIISIPNAIGIVLLPNVSEKFALTSQIQSLRSYLINVNHLFSVLMAFSIAMAWFWVPVLIHMILPKFIPGLSALRFLTLSTFFLALAQCYSDFVVASKNHLKQFPILLLTCLSGAGLIYMMVQQGKGIEGVAIARVSAMLIYFTFLFFLAGSLVLTVKEHFFELGKILAQFFFLAGILWWIDQQFSQWLLIPRAFAKTGLFLLLYSPILIQTFRHPQFGPLIKNKISSIFHGNKSHA